MLYIPVNENYNRCYRSRLKLPPHGQAVHFTQDVYGVDALFRYAHRQQNLGKLAAALLQLRWWSERIIPLLKLCVYSTGGQVAWQG